MTPAAILFATLASIAPPCITPQTALAGAVYYHRDIKAHLIDSAALSFVDAFNALEPVSSFVADEVIVVSVPRVPAVDIVLFHDGCAILMNLRMRIEAFDAIMPGA